MQNLFEYISDETKLFIVSNCKHWRSICVNTNENKNKNGVHWEMKHLSSSYISNASTTIVRLCALRLKLVLDFFYAFHTERVCTGFLCVLSCATNRKCSFFIFVHSKYMASSSSQMALGAHHPIVSLNKNEQFVLSRRNRRLEKAPFCHVAY